MYLAEKIALQKKEDIDKLDLKKKFEKGINKNALKKKKIKRSEKKKRIRVCLAPSFPSVIWVSLIEKVILGLNHH